MLRADTPALRGLLVAALSDMRVAAPSALPGVMTALEWCVVWFGCAFWSSSLDSCASFASSCEEQSKEHW